MASWGTRPFRTAYRKRYTARMLLDARRLVAEARARSGLTKQGFAAAAGTSRAALDQIEKGQRVPRVDTLTRAIEASGHRLEVTLHPATTGADEPAATLAGALAEVGIADPEFTWRWLVSDFLANVIVPASRAARLAALADEPEPTGRGGWDAFAAALAEHVAFHAQIPVPRWVDHPSRSGPEAFWWPVHGSLASMRAAALAHSPAAFKRRRVLVDGREIPRILP